MTSTTAAGSAIAISNGTPATLNAAGYAALAWDNIGLVEKIGTIGKVFAKVEFQGLKAAKDKLKGSADHGALTPSMAYDETDPGQIKLRAAADDATTRLYPIRVTYPSGEVTYFRGRVFGAPEGVEGADTIIMTTATIEICTPRIRVPAGAPATFLAGPSYVVMGDSRDSSMHNDQASTKRNRSAANYRVVAATQMGQRLIYVDNYAKAGQRPDEFNSSTAAMRAATADTLFLGGVINGIAQGQTGAQVWATMKAIIDDALSSGKKVIASNEPGGESFGATETGHRDTYNANLQSYRDANPNRLAVFDLATVCLVNFAPGVIPVFKTGYAADETPKIHLSHLGSRRVGEAYAAWLADKIGGTPFVLENLQANNLLLNAGFTGQTGGTPTGFTGQQPNSWLLTGVGGTISYVNGELVIASAAATAAGNRLNVTQQLSLSGLPLALNDKVRALAYAKLDAGATNVKSVRLALTSFYNGTAINFQQFDMQPDNRAIWGDTVGGTSDLLMPDPMTLNASSATTVDRIDVQIAVEFSASGGQCTLRTKLPTLLKI